MSADQPSLKEELEALEKVVRQLEGDDLDLDRALALFEEGVRRLRRTRERLAEAEVKVQQVLEQADGTVGFRDADV